MTTGYVTRRVVCDHGYSNWFTV
ncbi:unnamed protein product, partial [Candida parapsilosis]